MSTVLNKQANIDGAKQVITAYKSTCEDLYQKLSTEISNLRRSGFIGDASNGYDAFFGKLSPALTTNLTGDENSLTSMLNSILDAVAQMTEPVDPDIGQQNINAADGGEANG